MRIFANLRENLRIQIEGSERFFLILLVLFSLFNCTNFSVSKSRIAPPILVSVRSEVTNTYRIEARAQNPEIFFEGYRLYPGLTEAQSRNPANLDTGLDCRRGAGAPILPNQPLTYFFEIRPDEDPPGQGITCKFQANLEPGVFITLRTLNLSLDLFSSSGGLSQSGPSNTIILPGVSATDPDP